MAPNRSNASRARATGGSALTSVDTKAHASAAEHARDERLEYDARELEDVVERG
jgi:hypothetical protein